jgi:pilus assembly protein Flp/PilA
MHSYCESCAQTIIILSKGKAIMLFAPQEKGQGLIEYAIILSLVALIVIVVMRLLGPKVGDSYSAINSSIP